MTSGLMTLPAFIATGNKPAGAAAPAGSSGPPPDGFEKLLDAVQAKNVGRPLVIPVSSGTAVSIDTTALAASVNDTSTSLLSAGMSKTWSRKTTDRDAGDDPPAAPANANGDIAAMAQAVLLANTPVQLPNPPVAAPSMGMPGQDGAAAAAAPMAAVAVASGPVAAGVATPPMLPEGSSASPAPASPAAAAAVPPPTATLVSDPTTSETAIVPTPPRRVGPIRCWSRDRTRKRRRRRGHDDPFAEASPASRARIRDGGIRKPGNDNCGSHRLPSHDGGSLRAGRHAPTRDGAIRRPGNGFCGNRRLPSHGSGGFLTGRPARIHHNGEPATDTDI